MSNLPTVTVQSPLVHFNKHSPAAAAALTSSPLNLLLRIWNCICPSDQPSTMGRPAVLFVVPIDAFRRPRIAQPESAIDTSCPFIYFQYSFWESEKHDTQGGGGGSITPASVLRKKRRTSVCAIIKSDPRLFVVQCNWEQFVLPFSNMDCCTAFFTLIGVLAVANWMYSCFSSLVWITFYNILELWQPEKYSLEKRFGQWAGEKTKTK